MTDPEDPWAQKAAASLLKGWKIWLQLHKVLARMWLPSHQLTRRHLDIPDQ